MAKYVGMALKEVYAFACDEFHLKRNSRFYSELPASADAVDTVREIDVSKNYIGPKGLRALLEVVRSCPRLHTLVLRDQQLSKEAVLTLCDALVSHPALRTLDLRQNPITIDGGRHLFDLVQCNPRIEQVMLENTEVKDSLITAINARTARNRQHNARLEALHGSGSGSGSGSAARSGLLSGGASPTSVNAPLMIANDASAAGNATTSNLNSSGTLDASLAREIIHRCPISVSPLLLDEDITASLSERCAATRCHFLDPDFAPTVEAVSAVSADFASRVKAWKRLASFEGACVFNDAAAPREPLSVAPELAWFFTSLFTVLHGSELQSNLQALVSPSTVNPAGVYCVKFFIDGKWRCVLVDDYVPVGADGAPALCGTDAKNAFWPVLVLKAAAKLHGSYRALASTLVAGRHPTLERPVNCATVMSDFSGGVSVSRQLNHAQFDPTAWFQTMTELHEQRAWLVATSAAENEATSSGGIMPFHAYRIRQICAVNGNKLVQLHSALSRRVWIGDWGHSSPQWEQHQDVAQALGYRLSSTRGPSAPFWMRYSDFLACFNAVHACCPTMQSFSSLVEGAWVKSTAGGPAFEPTTWWCNPHYRLRLTQPTKVLIALSVPDCRFHSSNVTTMGLHMMRGDDYPLRCEKAHLHATTNYAVSNCVTYSAELPAGVLWVVPSAYDEGVHGRFFLRVVGSEPFSFSHENRDDHLKTYQIRCNLADSGEYQHGEMNPQFAILTRGTVPNLADPIANSGRGGAATCRIAVQMHAEMDGLNVGLVLCKSGRAAAGRGDDGADGGVGGGGRGVICDRSTSFSNGDIIGTSTGTGTGTGSGTTDSDATDRDTDLRLLGPIPDERIVARSTLIIGKTVFLDARVPCSSDPYILLPCVLPQHSLNVPLSLTVWCSQAPRSAVREVPYWPCVELGVEWTRSGGLQDVAQNPQIELVVRRPRQRFLIHLEVFGVTDPSLILYVVRQARGHEGVALAPGHRVSDSAIATSSQFVRHHTTTCEFEFVAPPEPGSLPAYFIVLPCLQPPGTSARGTLNVSSTIDDFDVSLLPVNTRDA